MLFSWFGDRRSGRRGNARWRLFVVDGESMSPGLDHGDGVIAVRSAKASVGQRRVVVHPHRPDQWLIKRVERLDHTHNEPKMWLISDNRDATLADSRTFGHFPVAGSYRVLLRVPRVSR